MMYITMINLIIIIGFIWLVSQHQSSLLSIKDKIYDKIVDDHLDEYLKNQTKGPPEQIGSSVSNLLKYKKWKVIYSID